jgi:hypothetical protein
MENDYLISETYTVAEGAGFEPAIRFPAYTLSRRAPSAARPPLHLALSTQGRAISLAPVAAQAGRRSRLKWAPFEDPNGAEGLLRVLRA